MAVPESFSSGCEGDAAAGRLLHWVFGMILGGDKCYQPPVLYYFLRKNSWLVVISFGLHSNTEFSFDI